MTTIWSYDHYEQNHDHREINDHGAWEAQVEDGKQFLEVVCNGEQTLRCQVEGDLKAAETKLKKLSKKYRNNWPSTLLGPQCEEDWDDLLEDFGLTRIGEPTEG